MEIIFVVLPQNCKIEFRENHKKLLNRKNKSCENFFPWKLLPLRYSVDLAPYFRWTGNEKVALWYIKAWDAIKQLYTFWHSLPKSKHLKCKSYFTLGNALKDNLIIAKLQFFAYVADLVEPFLTKYQTDKPMVFHVFMILKTSFATSWKLLWNLKS